MSDENESAGSVEVRVSRKQVRLAVLNILNNEMKLDPVQIEAKVRADAEKLIQEKVLAYLDGHGYSSAALSDRVQRHLSGLTTKFEQLLRDAVSAKVNQFIEQNLKATIDAVVKNTTFKLGWGYNAPTAKVTVEETKT